MKHQIVVWVMLCLTACNSAPFLDAAGNSVRTLAGHTAEIFELAYSPDGRMLAPASADGTVRLWDGNAGSTLCILTVNSQGVRRVAFNPDGRTLATVNYVPCS